MARIWITSEEGKSYLSLNYGMFEETELEVWGSLAADLVAHVVNAYLQDGGEFGKDAAFATVEKGFRERLADNPLLTGAFGGISLS